MGYMTIPLQFASLYDRQEISMWSSCLLDLGTDFLVGNMLLPVEEVVPVRESFLVIINEANSSEKAI